MVSTPRILIIDRSELASNLYRLLLAPLGAVLALRRSFEDARPDMIRRGSVQMIIINCNALGKKYDDIAARIGSEAVIAEVPKIFLCKEEYVASEMGRVLSALPRALVVNKPFHPQEFLAQVGALLQGGAQ